MTEKIDQFLDRRFYWVIAVVCVIYAVIEMIYVTGLPLVMDEFQGAYAVKRFSEGIPYRDFMPYKTVLGYYIQLPALMLPGGTWAKLMYVKTEMTAINTVAIFFACVFLARKFRRSAVVFAALLMVFTSTFLERSGALRVDMITAWFGLFSLLFTLERRMITAGLLVSLSFLTSQKGIYYALAAGSALFTYWLLCDRTKETFIHMVKYALAAIIPIAVYFGFFGLIGQSMGGVADRVILANKTIALESLYVEVKRYWFQTVERNPLFYGLTAMALGRLFSRREGGFVEWILWVYGAVFMGLCIWHRQPWPYFFVMVIPIGFVLIASLLHGEAKERGSLSIPFMAIILLVGVAFPLWLRMPVVLDRGNGSQKNTVNVADHVLGDNDPSLDGIRMMFNNPHPGGRFGWLDRGKLWSLRRTPVAESIELIEKSFPKIVIMNYRIRSFPRALYKHIKKTYWRLHGNVFIYSPTIKSGESRVKIRFDGTYRAINFKGGSRIVKIDGNEIKQGELLFLDAGEHAIDSTVKLRLRLEPEGWKDAADPLYKRQSAIFDMPYRY